MTRVKICGITRAEDAQLAAELGATWIGFVFWPGSPRCIAPSRAAEILSTLPPDVSGVGVFVDQPAEEIAAIADAVGLGAVQLHGEETVEGYGKCNRRVIKAVGLSGEDAVANIGTVWPEATLLLDAFDPIRKGGTGRTIDWVLAREIATRRRTVLSGGLRAENVAVAMRQVTPYGLDVSSGVESEPGVKDAQQMRAFFQAVDAAAASSYGETSGRQRTGGEGI